ncbi:MAG: peptidyl-prolyl cis-trans isomerase [Gemmatimonadota bacterium]
MFMRSLRDNTKWMMAAAMFVFAGWLVFDWVANRDQASATGFNPVIGVVNGEEIRYGQFSRILEGALASARSGGILNDEQRHQVEETSWDQLIDQILIEQEISRLGIEVTDEEIRTAFRLSPPPDLLSYPAFQTDGQFDYNKYQQFFSDPTVDEAVLLQIENYYRATLPRVRLSELLQDGIYMSDRELWRIFQDRNESASVEFVSINPAGDVPDDSVAISEDAIEAYYREHADDFERPAQATVHVVSFSTAPAPTDTAGAEELAAAIRAQILSGERTFAEAAQTESSDTLTSALGGELGRFGRGQLIPSLDSIAFALGENDVSRPVPTSQGFHLLQVSDLNGDTATVSHIVIPVQLSLEGEDYLFDQMDAVQAVALRDGLSAAADSLGIDITRSATITEGFDFVPGVGSLGVGVDWVFSPLSEQDSVSDFFESATGFHILELVSSEEEGTFALEEVRAQIEGNLRAELKTETAKRWIRDRLARLASGQSMEEVATDLGWSFERAGPFTRVSGGQALGQASEAIGAAFGSEVGAVTGPWEAGARVVAIRVSNRTAADQVVFEEQKDLLRGSFTQELRSTAGNLWLQSLREGANIVDLRDRLNQPADDAPQGPQSMG